MPELPEVETTRRGIAPHLLGRRLAGVVIRNPHLRWRVSPDLAGHLTGAIAREVRRRGKYLLLGFEHGWLIVHLGMSGSLRVTEAAAPARTHDHIDLLLGDGRCLRFHDPRRFGAMIWTPDPYSHPLIKHLGPEPWQVTAEYLWRRARGRRQAVKAFLMDARTVVGVGNIYASEALFLAGIRPRKAAGRVSRAAYARLTGTVVKVIEEAIAAGGTTLRDFVSAEGEPGYFSQRLRVYDREGKPCRRCRTPIRRIVITGRAAYYCPRCQR